MRTIRHTWIWLGLTVRSINPQAPLLSGYLTGLLCRSETLSAQGRTLCAIVVGLGDEGVDPSQDSSLLIYGQRTTSEGIPSTASLRLCVARRKPAPPPPSVRKVRPGEPLPRGQSNSASQFTYVRKTHIVQRLCSRSNFRRRSYPTDPSRGQTRLRRYTLHQYSTPPDKNLQPRLTRSRTPVYSRPSNSLPPRCPVVHLVEEARNAAVLRRTMMTSANAAVAKSSLKNQATELQARWIRMRISLASVRLMSRRSASIRPQLFITPIDPMQRQTTRRAAPSLLPPVRSALDRHHKSLTTKLWATLPSLPTAMSAD